MATLLELREQRAQLWERMKQIVDTAEGEGRDLSAEEEANWSQASADMASLDRRIDRQERMERTPAADPEPRGAGILDLAKLRAMPGHEVRATPEYAAAYGRYLRSAETTDDRQILMGSFVQSRALAANTPAAGGYLVPEGFRRQIETALLEFGGMREVATIMATDEGNDLPMPTSNDTSNTGEILAENAAATEQDTTFGARIYKAFMYSSKIIRVSFQLMQDSAFDLEGYLAGRLAERIGRITNTHFTTGIGANQPSGIAGDSVQGKAGATGQTTTVTWDDLIDLEHSVGIAYRRQRARFMFSDATLQAIRKLKDGNGQYLWQPGQPTGGFPNTIMQYPYTVNDDVADMAASANSIFFGALWKYIIRDVRGFGLIRFTEKYADQLQVGFLGFSRHDGGLLDAGTNPVKHYTNSAS